MDVVKTRRAALRAYVAKHFPRDGDPKGNVSQFAQKIGMQQSQVADMLDGRKAFGEKVAARLDALLVAKRMPAIDWKSVTTTSPDRVADTQAHYSVFADLSGDAIDLARDIEKLRPQMRAHLQALVTALVAAQKR